MGGIYRHWVTVGTRQHLIVNSGEFLILTQKQCQHVALEKQ